jgi:hypothetical protein
VLQSCDRRGAVADSFGSGFGGSSFSGIAATLPASRSHFESVLWEIPVSRARTFALTAAGPTSLRSIRALMVSLYNIDSASSLRVLVAIEAPAWVL